MKILLLEPFMGGSHAAWANGWMRHSHHSFHLLQLPARHWKWRMHGAAVTLAQQFLAIDFEPDLIVATDMLDLTTFLSLTRSHSAHIPVALYFHENQLTYPWSPTDQDVSLKRDNHYAFINYTSALSADRIFFNSHYHQTSFLDALPKFLKSFPDKKNLATLDHLKQKSSVLHLGMDLYGSFTPSKTEDGPPIFLWNHRWEYDKGPDEFFHALMDLQEEGMDFRLVVLGESYGKQPPIFAQAQEALADRILHWGYSPDAYHDWLAKADCLPVTSRQDFFGGSVVEAIYHNCWPLLPNRLAYPEHIPVEHREAVLYEEGQFKDKLKAFLMTPPNISTRGWVEHYDWSQLVDQYDDAMESVKRMV